MQTVIANRLAVGLAAPGRPQPGIGPDVAGREDFATRMAEDTAEKGASEDLARAEGGAASGLMAATFWSGVPLVSGRDGAWVASAGNPETDGVLVPPPVASSTGDLKLASVTTAGLIGTLSSDAVLSDGDAAVLASAAQAQGMSGHPRQELGLDGASFPSLEALGAKPSSGETEVAVQKAMAATDRAAAIVDDAVGLTLASGAASPVAAVASAGLRLWQDMLVQRDGPTNGMHDLAAPASESPPADEGLILSAPDALAVAPTAPPAALVAKLAETALLSLFAAQADAASLETSDGVMGFAPTGTPGAIASASAMSGPVAVPQLAAQLVHTLAHNAEGTTEIALSPDELGHVRVTLQADPQNPDRLVVILNFERPETLDLFRRHADQLAEALRDAGFAGADIGFGHSGSGGNSDPQPEPALADQPPQPDPATGWVPGLAPGQSTARLAASSALDIRL